MEFHIKLSDGSTLIFKRGRNSDVIIQRFAKDGTISSTAERASDFERMAAVLSH